jgi:hypothetical protein
MLGAVNDASGAALRSLPRPLTAAARDHLSVRKAARKTGNVRPNK